MSTAVSSNKVDQQTTLRLSDTTVPEIEIIDTEHLAVDDLRELMRSVDETTRNLQATHVALHQQVAHLQGELAEANAQLRRSRSLAALGEMAAGIAHEIRNPLGSIQLYIQMLAEDVSNRPEQVNLCEKINLAVVGLDNIVRDVLTFAREMKVKPIATTAEDLMQRALSACESLLVKGEVTVIQPESINEPRALKADDGLIVQSLANVIRNAVEAMIEHKNQPLELTLGIDRRRVRCPDGKRASRVVMSVEDTGPGIPEDVIERMFNPFFTTRATGTGLGLAIVNRIVEAHGGHVNARNRSGGGAVIELCLPSKPSPDLPSESTILPVDARDAQQLAHDVRNQIIKEEQS